MRPQEATDLCAALPLRRGGRGSPGGRGLSPGTTCHRVGKGPRGPLVLLVLILFLGTVLLMSYHRVPDMGSDISVAAGS